MIKYIKDSFRELKHVVWPTREETKNYFITVVSILVLFGVYLFIASTVFTEWLFALKNLVNPKSTIEKSFNWNSNKAIDLNAISKKVQPTVKVNKIKVAEKNNSIQKETVKNELKTEEKVEENTSTWVLK